MDCRLFFLWVLAIGVVGCTHYQAEPLAPAQSRQDFRQRRLDQPELQAILRQQGASLRDLPASDMVWDSARLTLAAFFFSPETAAARARWAVARARIAEAAAHPNPSLGVSPAFNTSTPASAGISSWIWAVSLDIPWDWPPQRRARMAAAQARARVAWFALVEGAWQTRVQVRDALLHLYGARQALVLQRARVDILQKRRALLDRQLDLGASSRLSVQQAQQALTRAQQDVLETEQAETAARATLAQSVGVPAAALAQVTFDFHGLGDPPATQTTAQAREQALLNRADILEQLAVYAAAEARLQWEVAQQIPGFSGGPAYEFDQSEHKWGLNAALTLPVFNQNRAPIETARRERAAEAAAFYALQARVSGDLDQAVAGYDYARRRFDLADQACRVQQENFAILEKQVVVGTAARAALWDGRLAVLHGQQARLAALLEAQNALGRLEQVVESSVDLPHWQDALTGLIENSEVATHED